MACRLCYFGRSVGPRKDSVPLDEPRLELRRWRNGRVRCPRIRCAARLSYGRSVLRAEIFRAGKERLTIDDDPPNGAVGDHRP